ncbi:hypothetical protein I317_04176 [Kwoniella heveanensis CBS 569]|nr:hypothetical protein I317_04176 [Kwoniella heveanensis CBS 569]
MNDLSSLSSALQAVLDSPGGGETLVRTVEKQLTSPDTDTDITTKRAVCETLLEILNDESGGGQSLEERRAAILGDTALTYTPLFLPLVLHIPQATDLLVLLARYSNPKETILALVEGVQSIIERAEGFTVSDDEEEGTLEGEVDWADLVLEYEVVLRCFVICIPRLTTSKSTPTLLSIDEALSSSLPLTSHQTTTTSARKLLGLMCELVDGAWKWVKGTLDVGGEQRAILSNLLFMAVTLLGHKVDGRLIDRWFLSAFPRFQNLPSSNGTDGGDLDKWVEGADILEKAMATASSLNFSSTDLLKRIIDPTSLSIYASLASLNLLSSTLPSNSDNLSEFLPSPLPVSLLDDSMPILCAALSGSSVDAGVTWTWALVHRSGQEQGAGHKGLTLDYDNASMLIELLVPLTAQHPSPTTRLALFKLIGAIVGLQSSATDRIELFRQLLEPANPFENIRIQSLSLVREQLSPRNNSEPVPILLEELGPVLFALPSDEDPDDSPFVLEPEKLLASFYPTWWTEVLSLLWFTSTRIRKQQHQLDDVAKYTEKGDAVIGDGQSVRVNEWINLVETKLREVQQYLEKKTEAESGHGHHEHVHDHAHVDAGAAGIGREAFMLTRWEDALQRVQGRSLKQTIV